MDDINNEWKIGKLYQLIPNRLFFTVHENDNHTLYEIKKDKKKFFFSSNIQENYIPYCLDFGPITYDSIIQFCQFINIKFNDIRLNNRPLIYYCDDDEKNRTNTAFLLACYLLLEHKYTPQKALKPFINIYPYPFRNYRDPSYEISNETISIRDCIYGLYKAIQYNWLEYEKFDIDNYNKNYNNIKLNYTCIIQKFIAFSSPFNKNFLINHIDHDEYNHCAEPIEYIEIFKKQFVTTVVRLNEPLYDKKEFTDNNINHYDLFFEDCTIPSIDIVKKFLKICVNTRGVIAVHCKSGIGRTGTLIAIWILLNYDITAKEVIGFLRIIRPGCIIGIQQKFLEDFYKKMCKNNKRDVSLKALIDD